jgi:hypothetical protein
VFSGKRLKSCFKYWYKFNYLSFVKRTVMIWPALYEFGDFGLPIGFQGKIEANYRKKILAGPERLKDNQNTYKALVLFSGLISALRLAFSQTAD